MLHASTSHPRNVNWSAATSRDVFDGTLLADPGNLGFALFLSLPLSLSFFIFAFRGNAAPRGTREGDKRATRGTREGDKRATRSREISSLTKYKVERAFDASSRERCDLRLPLCFSHSAEFTLDRERSSRGSRDPLERKINQCGDYTATIRIGMRAFSREIARPSLAYVRIFLEESDSITGARAYQTVREISRGGGG